MLCQMHGVLQNHHVWPRVSCNSCQLCVALQHIATACGHIPLHWIRSVYLALRVGLLLSACKQHGNNAISNILGCASAMFLQSQAIGIQSFHHSAVPDNRIVYYSGRTSTSATTLMCAKAKSSQSSSKGVRQMSATTAWIGTSKKGAAIRPVSSGRATTYTGTAR